MVNQRFPRKCAPLPMLFLLLLIGPSSSANTPGKHSKLAPVEESTGFWNKVKNGFSWLAKKLTPVFHQDKCFVDEETHPCGKGLKGKVNEKVSNWFKEAKGVLFWLFSPVLYLSRLAIWTVMYYYDGMFSWIETTIVCSQMKNDARNSEELSRCGKFKANAFAFFRYSVYWALYFLSFWTMAQFQLSMPYLWAMLFSNAIFFAGDWVICKPLSLCHSSFACGMANNRRRVDLLPGESPSSYFDSEPEKPNEAAGMLFEEKDPETSPLARPDTLQRMINDPRRRVRPLLKYIPSNDSAWGPPSSPARTGTSSRIGSGPPDPLSHKQEDDEAPAPSPEFKAWPSGVRAGIPGLARRRLMERLARLSCSL